MPKIKAKITGFYELQDYREKNGSRVLDRNKKYLKFVFNFF